MTLIPTSHISKIFAGALVPVGLAVTLFTCQQQEKKAAQAAAITESAVAVKLAPVVDRELSVPVTASGLISTEKESRQSFKIGGIVARIFVDEGDVVSKGQLLAVLDQTEIKAQVSQAKNNLDKTRRDLERGKRLYSDSAATLEQMQNLQTAFDVAEEGFRIATFNQEYASIRASGAGRVLKRFVNEGELVGAGTPVLMTNVTGDGNWILKSGLTDVDWVRVRKGDRAVITTDAYGSETLEGEVTLVGESADPFNGLYPIEVRIRAGATRLASGLFARVQIIPADKKHYRTIPVEALIEGQGHEAFVFVAQPDRTTVRKIPVRVLQLLGSEALIVGGLDNVQEVIAAGPAFLTEFSTIRITE